MLTACCRWQQALRVIAGLVLFTCLCGALMRPLKPMAQPPKPREKNMLDRLYEQAKTKMGVSRHESIQNDENIAEVLANYMFKSDAPLKLSRSVSKQVFKCFRVVFVLQKVREMKLNREKLVREELGESEPNSTLCSGYFSQDGASVARQAPAAQNSDVTSPVKPPQIVVENGSEAVTSAQTRAPIYKPRARNDSLGRKGGNALHAMLLQKKLDELQNGGKPQQVNATDDEEGHLQTLTSAPLLSETNGVRQMSLPLATSPDEFRSSDGWAVKTVKNGMSGRRQTAASPAELKIEGHLKADYSRPLYRKDIFYSGSFLKIPEYHTSQQDVATYVKSVTSIPEVGEPVQESRVWRVCACLPKPFTDVLKQMFDFSILHDPVFLIACIANMVGFLGIFVPFVFVAERAMSLGVDKGQATLLVSIIGQCHVTSY